MGKSTKIMIMIGILLIVFVAILIIKNHINNKKPELTELKENKKSIISCFTIDSQNNIPTIDFSGKIKSVNKIKIISEVNGISELQK